MIEALLPKSVRDLITHIGVPATMALVKEYGGMNDFRVPKCPAGKVFNRITAIIGHETASILIAVYADERPNIPRCWRLLLLHRNLSIQVAYDGGERVEDIARRYGLTVKRVRQILNTPLHRDGLEDYNVPASKDDGQLALFSFDD